MNGNMVIGQYYPGDSAIHRLDPRIKIVAALFYFIALFMAKQLLAYGLLGAFAIFTILLSRVPGKMLLKGLKPLLFLLIITAVLNGFLTEGQTLWRYGFLVLTKEGLWQGLWMAGRLLLLVLISSLLTLTTTPLSITDALEHLFRPGQKIGLPAQELAMMIAIAMRFIPTLAEEAGRIAKAQASRGMDMKKGSLRKRVSHMFALIVPFFLSALQRADDLALAMESRGYQPGVQRSRMKQLSLTRSDFMVLAWVFVFMIFIALLRFTG